MARIGFVGLGHMGLPMAINLLKAGHQVMGFDREQVPMNALKKAGGSLASTLQDVALEQDVVITMLQTGEQVKSVCLGEDVIDRLLEHQCRCFTRGACTRCACQHLDGGRACVGRRCGSN